MCTRAVVQIQYQQHQIDNLKSAWGKAAFDLALAGDLAAVANLAAAQAPEKARLEAKIAELTAKKKATQGGASAAPGAPPPPPAPQMTVVVPQGCGPGSVFNVQLPDGQICSITVPPGVQPGSQIAVDMPLNTQPIVQGTPV